MGKRRKSQVKIVGKLAVFELGGFGKAFPDPLQIGSEGCLKIGERCGTNMVADDEEEEGAAARTMM